MTRTLGRYTRAGFPISVASRISGPPLQRTQTNNTHQVPEQRLKSRTPTGIAVGPPGWKKWILLITRYLYAYMI